MLAGIISDTTGDKLVNRHIDIQAAIAGIDSEPRTDRNDLDLIGKADIAISLTDRQANSQQKRTVFKVLGHLRYGLYRLVMPCGRIFQYHFGVFAKYFDPFVRVEYLELVKGLQNLVNPHLFGETDLAIGRRNQRTRRHHPFQKGPIALTFQTFLKHVAERSYDTAHKFLLNPANQFFYMHTALTSSGLRRIHYRMGVVF